MTRSGAQWLALVAAASSAVTLAGCSAGRSVPRPDTSSSTSASTSASTAASSPPDTPATDRSSPDAPRPGSMDEPGTSSGPLSKAAFPRPRQLGQGWRFAVDRGDPEEGYAGNGTPALARDPLEVARTAVPLGCARRAGTPVPRHALEVDYTLHDATVVTVRTSFAGPLDARRFFAGRSADLRACAGRVASPAIGPLVAAISEPAADALASDRTPRSDPWREVALLDRDTVVLVAARGRDPLDAGQTRRLVRLFRTRPAAP